MAKIDEMMAELTALMRDDPDLHNQYQAAVDAIMRATDGMPRLIVGAALARCQAGFYARLAFDAGDPPEVAAAAVYVVAHPTAELAAELVEKARQAVRDR